MPQYHLDISRAGFIYRGANLFKSLTRSIREEKKTKVFKGSVKEWVKVNIGIRPNIFECLLIVMFRNLESRMKACLRHPRCQD